jgi:hypothetical protein
MTDERIISYLLEELREGEIEQVEDECLADESWLAQINLIEGDLIDAYLRGELPPERRQRFEQNYLTTARLKRVRMAAALLRCVDQYSTDAEVAVVPAAEHTSTWWLRDFWSRQAWSARAAVAFAVVIIIAGAWWLFIPRTTGPNQVGTRMPYATLVLSVSNGDRAEGARAGRVKLTPDAETLKIVLTLPEVTSETGEYRAQIENARGEIKFTKRIPQLDARSLSVLIPVEQLARGQYAVKLFAIKADGTEQRIGGSYLFTVE